ncbi:glycosyl hydrolase 53 family protein [Williamsia sp. CHRR-6]|uniref:glycosyl hydrolase 53 family protein n=1 Tax=Williamsia sp. CHRR-6 TaxID=2835871 RepID=UPI001BDB58B0|nr:glycosyl hydrolase 53 family protein [Williamsia sp. CHRR-6]MBT0565447.1 glycosyl hydrolase 53 family protein [Williamsia sp. CHRR-6]
MAVASSLAVSTAMAPQASAAPPAVPADGYGFGAASRLLTLSPTDLNRELDAVATTRATWLKVLIDRSQIERSRGVYDWSVPDRIILGARQRNLRVLANLMFTPAWAGGGITRTNPPDPQDFANFALLAATRYRTFVTDFQVWNEPNLGLFWGFQNNRAAAYARMMAAAYPAIKAAQPDATVVFAGLSRATGGDAPPTFLQQFYAAGGRGTFDAMAMHPYIFYEGWPTDPDNALSDVDRTYRVMIANGDAQKKIWFTEIGAPTQAFGGLDQPTAAIQTLQILAFGSVRPFVGPAFIYMIRDSSNDFFSQFDRESHFGALYTSDWRPKPLLTLLRK